MVPGMWAAPGTVVRLESAGGVVLVAESGVTLELSVEHEVLTVRASVLGSAFGAVGGGALPADEVVREVNGHSFRGSGVDCLRCGAVLGSSDGNRACGGDFVWRMHGHEWPRFDPRALCRWCGVARTSDAAMRDCVGFSTLKADTSVKL